MSRLSETQTGKAWISQFDTGDQPDAARLLDALRLMDDADVSNAIRGLLQQLCEERIGPRRRIALYAEREISKRYAFDVVSRTKHGVKRIRAVGSVVPAVKPRRGQTRVGSEGPMAFIVSQAVETWPKSYVNHPGPDRFRGRRPIGAIAIVTDFIGSGTRVSDMLTKFWNVPSVRSWRSRGWIDFFVVAAAGTANGVARVGAHRAEPVVRVAEIVPTLAGGGSARPRWRAIAERYGPPDEPLGYGNTAALVAFSYRMPNNAPAIIRRSFGAWKSLFQGSAPQELWPLFGADQKRRLTEAAAELGLEIAGDLHSGEARVALFLASIQGRFRPGSEVALAEMSGLSVPDVLQLYRSALKQGLLSDQGRLTDAGHKALAASEREMPRRAVVPTETAPYYPKRLRVPRRDI